MGYRRRRMNQLATPAELPLPLTARHAVLEFKADLSFGERNRQAVDDLIEGLRLWRLSCALAWLDIRLRYRGSMLGPFWLTLSTSIMVAMLGFLYAKLFKMDLRTYLPFLALSQVLWAFMGTVVAEACTTYIDMVGIIRSVRMPMSVFALRTIVRNVLVLAHNVVVIVVVFAIFRIWPGWHAFLAIPGLFLWLVVSLSLTMLLGSLCARFRDIAPIVNSLMQIAFFITPVIWRPEQLGDYQFLLPFNPFYNLLEIVRAPLLGEHVATTTWLIALGFSAGICAVSWLFFIRARGRLAFWV